ncbi:polyprotein, partial [Watermelon leaf mottle virus]
LNMNAAVGSLFVGKKRAYFETCTAQDREDLVQASCKRLYYGEKGVWNGSLKAELRPIEKVELKKTRTFTAAPIDTLLGGKVCVDDFNQKFYNHHIKGPWTVGMTKFYKGWDELLNCLPDNWIYCDADGSQFDSSITPYIMNAVLKVREHFMEDWDLGKEMLRNLYTEIVYTPISTPDGTIIKKHKGNNSGQPSTVVDNSLIVCIAVKYALLKEGLKPEEFDNVIRFFVNGDDLLIAVKPSHEHILNNFSEYFAELGLNYEFDNRHTDKSRLWFMSHCGIRDEDIWIPKLEPERIVSILEWDRSKLPENRLEAVCAAMVEAWGYNDLLHQIRLFYQWLLEQEPFNDLAANGYAPYISEVALRALYTGSQPTNTSMLPYLHQLVDDFEHDADEDYEVHFQSGEKEKEKIDTEEAKRTIKKLKEVVDAGNEQSITTSSKVKQDQISTEKDKDVSTSTRGTFAIPKLRLMNQVMKLPKIGNRNLLNLEHLLTYKPEQVDISNTRATKQQFETWCERVRDAYGLKDDEMSIVMNGFMVWCIENGTSPNVNGVWTMMDGTEQNEYPLKPMVENAKPTLRQIMAHFSDAAEAYIEMRNTKEPYMPRYGQQRNLTDMSLARCAFDFYEMTSRTPARVREAHIQMKAAALRNTRTRMFGLDGNVGTQEEDTERHTTEDVNRNMHNLLGLKM